MNAKLTFPRFFRFFSAVGLATLALALAACAPAGGSAGLRPVPVADVQIQVGVGSPIPVDVFVSGGWPDLCAQLAEIKQAVEGNRIEISLMATAADPNCPPDLVGLPFRIGLPINVVELQHGDYTVAVNGVETQFTWPSEPTGS